MAAKPISQLRAMTSSLMALFFEKDDEIANMPI
jgi:hypothetical protein